MNRFPRYWETWTQDLVLVDLKSSWTDGIEGRNQMLLDMKLMLGMSAKIYTSFVYVNINSPYGFTSISIDMNGRLTITGQSCKAVEVCVQTIQRLLHGSARLDDWTKERPGPRIIGFNVPPNHKICRF